MHLYKDIPKKNYHEYQFEIPHGFLQTRLKEPEVKKKRLSFIRALNFIGIFDNI
jgi:hypothetical protein